MAALLHTRWLSALQTIASPRTEWQMRHSKASMCATATAALFARSRSPATGRCSCPQVLLSCIWMTSTRVRCVRLLKNP